MASDVRESLFFLRYKPADNQLTLFCDDTNPRWITKCCFVDYSTVASVDKFGNFAVVRKIKKKTMK